MNSKYVIILVVVGLAALGWFAYSSIDKPKSVEEFVVVEEPEEPKQSGVFINPAPRIIEESAVEADVGEDIVPPVSEEETVAIVLPEDASLEQRFEFTLNTMLKDVFAQTQEYQKQRKVMKELARVDNLTDKVYLDENVGLFQEVVSGLYAKSADILKAFEKADADINALVQEKPEADRALILGKWNALKQKDAAAYQKFFEQEHDLITAHDRLVRFYFTKKNFFEVDEETGAVIFVNESDERLARRLLLQVNRMERTQGSVLSGK